MEILVIGERGLIHRRTDSRIYHLKLQTSATPAMTELQILLNKLLPAGTCNFR